MRWWKVSRRCSDTGLVLQSFEYRDIHMVGAEGGHTVHVSISELLLDYRSSSRSRACLSVILTSPVPATVTWEHRPAARILVGRRACDDGNIA